MAEVINTNVFNAEKKFVDFAGLDYFWGKAKTYIDDVDTTMSAKVVTIEGDVANLKTTVGDANSGLIKDFNELKTYTESLGDIEGGEGLGGMIDSKIAALDVEDTAVDGQYVSSVSETDGKITVTRAALPVYEEVGVAADLNTAMDARVKVLEAIDHNKIAEDAAAAAVAGVIDGAPEKFDTLKEIAAWIAEADTAEDAASLVTRVKALEDIEHDAYVGADATVLAEAKSYADGLASNYDAAGSAATAKTEAIADAASKYQVKGNYETAGTADAKIAALDLPNTYEAKGSAATAKAEAIAQAKLDAAETLASYYKKTETYSKAEVDNLLNTNSSGDRSYAKQYTDELFSSIKFAANSDIDALFASN